MEEFYLQVRAVHIGAVIASGSLFVLRSFAHNFLGSRWPVAQPARVVSWSIDTVLLTAALMLMTIVRQYPFADGWLTMKLALLIVYIVLGWFAFRAKRKAMRLWTMGAAIGVFGFIATVARAHAPLGIFSAI